MPVDAWRKQVVGIKVPTGEPGKVKVGTGVRVAPCRVLTCKHCVEDWAAETCDPTRVYFLDPELPGETEAERKRHRKKAAVTAVYLHPAADLAVLSLDCDPWATEPPVTLGGPIPKAGTRWETRGYPQEFAAATGLRPSGHLGEVVCIEGAQLILGVDYPPEYWHGVSGAPVVVENRIVALGRAWPKTGYRSRRLEAVWLEPLLLDPDFRLQLGLPEVDRALLDKLVRIIEGERLTKLLCDQELVDGDRSSTGLARALCHRVSHDLLGVLLKLRVVAQLFRKQPELLETSPSQGRPVTRLLEVLMPHAFAAIAAQVEGERSDRFTRPKWLSATAVEAIMAHRVGRAAAWQMRDVDMSGTCSVDLGQSDPGMNDVEGRRLQLARLLSARLEHPFAADDAASAAGNQPSDADVARQLRRLNGVLLGREEEFRADQLHGLETELEGDPGFPHYLMTADGAEVVGSIGKELSVLGIVHELQAHELPEADAQWVARVVDRMSRIIKLEAQVSNK